MKLRLSIIFFFKLYLGHVSMTLLKTKKKLINGIKIWIVEVGEPLPIPGVSSRLMRAGQLAERLVKDNVDVTWWVSDFNHANKSLYDLEKLPEKDEFKVLANGIKAKFLHGRTYHKNASIARLLHNRDIAKNFRRTAFNKPRPDLIFCCYPTIDLAVAATDYGYHHDVPVILDIRDLWPEVFIHVLPTPYWLNKLLIKPIERIANHSLKRATALSAISEPILNWGLKKIGRKRNDLDHVFHLSYEKSSLSRDVKNISDNQWRSLGLKLDGSELIACCIGNLSHIPEFETMVGALDYLSAELLQKIRIVICGTGPRLSWFQKMASKHPQLLVSGQVGAHEISSIMSHSFTGLLLYPTNNIFNMSFPNKVGEYLSAGLPIISTLGGHCGALLLSRQCGTVIKNHDVEGFARVLEKMSKLDKDWKHMSDCAVQVFNDMFHAEKNYKKMSAHITQIALSNQHSKKVK